MIDSIESDGPVPKYIQLADILEQRIVAGELQPNKPLPSEKFLMAEYGVARGTARRAVEVLRDRDLVFTVPQRGTFVKPKDS
jgi:DNA-binding GntR family transcriptional regulator